MKHFLLCVSLLALGAALAFGIGQPADEEESGAGMVPEGRYKEAPMLAEMVARGELPPVDERLPNEPRVVPPVQEIGRYGGTLHTHTIDPNAWNDLNESPENSNSKLLSMNDDYSIVGNLAKDYELADDGKSMTVYLREGTRWSDGAPFTAADILFKFEDLHWNESIDTWDYYTPNVVRVRALDDYTVRFEMDEPFFAIEIIMCQWIGGEWGSFHPKHYLEKWHINYNDDADELAAEEGFDSWSDAFQYHYFWTPTNDIEKPTMVHWMFTDYTDTVKAWERNPYFFQVDEAGQQLPYVDRVISTIADPEIYNLKAISGESDLAAMFTSADNWTLYKENEQSGGYRVIGVPGQIASTGSLWINQNHEDPALREVLNDVRFRQALSLAIDRDELNDVVYLGLGTPFAATALPNTSFFKEEWGRAFIDYDPDEANRLLDEMGLTERDRNGFRVRSDGETIVLGMEYRTPHALTAEQLELVKEYWEAVGLESRILAMSGELWNERSRALDRVIQVQDFETTGEVVSYNYTRAFPRAAEWSQWLSADADVRAGRATLDDFEGGVLPGEEPPEDIKLLRQWADQKPTVRFLSQEYRELSQKIYDLWAQKVYVIGTIGMLPQPFLVDVNLGNVPEEYARTVDWAGDILNQSAQFFWKE